MELPVIKYGSLVKIVAVSELCYEGYIESDLRDAWKYVSSSFVYGLESGVKVLVMWFIKAGLGMQICCKVAVSHYSVTWVGPDDGTFFKGVYTDQANWKECI